MAPPTGGARHRGAPLDPRRWLNDPAVLNWLPIVLWLVAGAAILALLFYGSSAN